MGSRDYRHHETKKAKKSAKKISVSDILPPQTVIEVIGKKGKKDKEDETDR